MKRRDGPVELQGRPVVATLRVTPAMDAGLSDHVSEIAELAAVMPKPVAKTWRSVKLATAVG